MFRTIATIERFKEKAMCLRFKDGTMDLLDWKRYEPWESRQMAAARTIRTRVKTQVQGHP